jgi:hypothetical protein
MVRKGCAKAAEDPLAPYYLALTLKANTTNYSKIVVVTNNFYRKVF